MNTKSIIDEKKEVIKANGRSSQEENILCSENYIQDYRKDENDYENLRYSSDEYYQTIEEESIELTKRIEFCSETCSKVMNLFKDFKKKSEKKKVIVFISSNPKTIDSTLRKSLEDYDVALDYRLKTDIPIDFNNYDRTNYQMFIVIRDINLLETLNYPDQEFIIIDLGDKKNSKKSSSYLDLMVKNIKKYNTFDISNTLTEYKI